MKNIDIIIEKYHDETGLSYIDSVIDFVEEHELDPYEIHECLSVDTINKLKAEFIQKKVVKGERVRSSDLTQIFNLL